MVKLFFVSGVLSTLILSPAFSMDKLSAEDNDYASCSKQKASSSSATQREDTAVGVPTYEEAIELYQENQKEGLRALKLRRAAGCSHSRVVLAAWWGLQDIATSLTPATLSKNPEKSTQEVVDDWGHRLEDYN